MNVKTDTDETLIRALQQKDLDALEELYGRHHRTALAVAFRVLQDRNLAEDVIQEAFLAVWRKPEAFKPERGSGRTWLLSIVRHRAIDITRGRSYDKESLSLDEIAFEPRSPDAWQNVSRKLDQEHIREALDALPVEQREAIVMAYFGGYTLKEVSESIGVPLGTVKGRVRLGMQKMKSLLTEIDAGAPH